MRRTLALALAVLALAGLSLGAAALTPPTNAPVQTGTLFAFSAWAGNETVASNEPVAQGESTIAFFAVHALAPSNASRYAIVDVSTTVATFAPVQLNLTIPPNSTDWASGNVTVPTGTNASGPAFNYTATVFESGPNGSVVLETFAGSGPLIVTGTIQAPAPFLTTPVLIGGGIVVLLAVAIGAYSVRQRNVRRRMRGKTRSTTLQQLEQEEKAKKPEQQAQVQQEIRQQEVVRTQRREMQILEAKRADAQKGLDLLKKRHEMGALSKLQYDNMSAKRRAELERIEAEIEQMEREG